jgi:hypothetical protein
MYQSLPIPALLNEWLAWATWINGPDRDESKGEDFPGFDEFCWIVDHEPEKAWEAILTALEDERFSPYLGNLAAGPLEDLLGKHSDLVLERVEARAAKDPRFATLLAGVWQYTMSDETWSRVQLAARTGTQHNHPE